MPELAAVSVGRVSGEDGETKAEFSERKVGGRMFSSWPDSLLVDSIEVKEAGNSGSWSDVLRMLLLWRRDCAMNGYC